MNESIKKQKTKLVYQSCIAWTWMGDNSYRWTGNNFTYVVHLYPGELLDDLEVWGAGKILYTHKTSGYIDLGIKIRNMERING